MEIVELAPGDERLRATFPVLAELRTHLVEAEFRERFESCHRDGLRIAAVFEAGECRAVAGYRIYTNLLSGRHMYIDDLVTSERWRSRRYGKALNDHLAEKARREGCESLQLDSAVHRSAAHRFYFRERYSIRSFHFERTLQ